MHRNAPQLLLAAILFASAAARAGTVGTALEHAEVFQGEYTRYQVTYENLKGAPAPDLSHLEKDFKVEFLDSTTSQQMTVIGAKITNISNVNYFYRITPKRLGRLTVTGPVVAVDGNNQKGPDQVLNVVEPEKQDLVLAELQVSKPRIYVQQEFDVTLRVFVRPLPDVTNRDPVSVLRRHPLLLINWLKEPDGLSASTLNEWLEPLVSATHRGFGFDAASGTSINSVFNLLTGMEKRPGLDGAPKDYHVYELKRRFRADKAGTYNFGPAIVKGEFVNSIQSRGPERGYYSLQRLRALSPSAAIEVRDVPANAPATFSGAIGAYKLTSSAAPLALRVGDPLTLTLTLERGAGAGSLDRVAAPDLSANAKLAADFEIVDRNPTGEVNGNTKKFSYSLRPKRAGVSIPELTASIFDADKEAFAEIAAPPIPLKVTDASALNASEIVGALGKRNTQDLRSAESGIFQNVADVREVRNELAHPLRAGVAVAGAWLAALAGGILLARRRSFAGDTARQRREGARGAATRKLDEARRAPPAQAAHLVREAVAGLVADLRNRPAAGFTSADALSEMVSAPKDLQDKTRALLEALEAVEYAPQSAVDSVVYIRKAAELLPEIHRALEKSR